MMRGNEHPENTVPYEVLLRVLLLCVGRGRGQPVQNVHGVKCEIVNASETAQTFGLRAGNHIEPGEGMSNRAYFHPRDSDFTPKRPVQKSARFRMCSRWRLRACRYYTVNGVKKWITGGRFADFFTTLVKTWAPE